MFDVKGCRTISTLPAGCKLSNEELAGVAARYARAAEGYQATVRYENDRALVDLHGPKVELKDLIEEMIAREGDCCSHLRFEVSGTTTGYAVVLTVAGAPELHEQLLRQTVPVLFPGATPV